MVFDFVLLDSYMVYNNSFDFIIKVLGKDLPIKILQTSKLIECHYNCIEYSQKNKFIDTNLKLAMKHFFIQAQVDYLDSICKKNNITTHDLGFFTNMFVMRGLTSSPAIDLLNISINEYQKINTTFFSDKKICGAIGHQYLSPITSFVFTEDWSKLSQIHKYEKILDHDKNFNLKMLNDLNCAAEALWENKLYSDNYNDFDSFLNYFKNVINQQYWIHNFGDYKIYKSANNYYLYPEIYQILYNLKFDFDPINSQSKIYFDSLFFDKNFIEEKSIVDYKNFEEFKNSLVDWREKGEIIEFKKNIIFVDLLKNKFIIDDFLKSDLNESLKSVISRSKKNEISCFLFFLGKKNVNTQKLKTVLKDSDICFYYYIPFYETINNNSGLLFLGLNKLCVEDLNFFFKEYKFYEDDEKIVSFLLDNINWEATDLYNHYLYWNQKNIYIVSAYLDFISGGLVSLLPETWNT